MTDRRKDVRSLASSRRAFFGASAAALAAGSLLPGSLSARAQGVDSTPTPDLNTAQATSTEGYIVANVKTFGAVGDNDTDDTAAIQAAIDSLGTVGGQVYFPNGVYLTSAALTVNPNTGLLGESHSAKIHATTADAAIKVADTQLLNSGISFRHLEIRGFNTTPIGIDARYMTGSMIDDCEVTQFNQSCIYYGGNTTENVNASWSNTVKDSVIRNSPACIYLNGVHSTGGSPANWITIERCMISPRDTTDSIGIDLVNGGAARVINNDISYAPNATGIMLRQRTNDVFDGNRFEDIGQNAPSHEIEKEFGFATFQFLGVRAHIHYQPAEYLEFTNNPTGGTFTLTRGVATTGAIAFSTDGETLADSIRSALEDIPAIGAGDVQVTAINETSIQIAWLNGRGRSDRPHLTADASGLTGNDEPGISVIQGRMADAIRQSEDMVLAGVTNDVEMASVSDLGPHMDVGVPLVTRKPIVAIDPDGAMAIQLQLEGEQYPRMGLSTNGRIAWTNPETGEPYGGLGLLSDNPDGPGQPAIGWDDDLNVALSRHTIVEGDGAVASTYRGSLYRIEGEPGTRDQLRFGMKESDDETYVRHLYPGFTVRRELEFSSIESGSVTETTVTATGARMGDAVLVTPPPGLEAGLMATGFVSDMDTVSIRVFNGSDDTLSSATATWTILILQP